jgi:hypothetical protein
VQPFKVFGPTCDAADAFPEAWLLPADTRAGDFIEVGMAGAYAKALASSFNGFGELIETEVETLNHSTAGVHAHVRPPHSALSDKHGRT